MKCQHCAKREATFYYQNTVNGHTTEARVCADCAAALGYDRAMETMYRRSLDMFRNPFGLLSDPFFDRLLTEFPAPGNTLEEARETAVQPQERSILPEEESRSFDLQRQRNALQYRLRQAVETENYEEAARMRDALRALPNE